MPLRIADENLSQWPDLRRFAVEPWSFHPGILLFAVPAGECRFGLTFPWVQRLFALVVSMNYIFCNRLPKNRIGSRLEVTHAPEIAVANEPAGKIKRRRLTIKRKVGNRQVVFHAAANLEPFRVHGGHGTHIDEINLLDELRNLRKQSPDHLQFVHAERRWAVEIDRVCHPAYGEVLDVRCFRSQDTDDLKRLSLVFQRLNVMGKCKKVDFRGQLHRWMSPVAVRENSKLPAARYCIYSILRRFQFIS